MFPSQPVQVNCPQCRQPFMAQVQSIIDVGQQPKLKEQLLRGKLNLATCPFCGHSGVLGMPMLYHDPSKQLLLCLTPMDITMKREEQEKLIGSLTNRLMDALPPERRRAYLFQPRTVFSLQRLIEEVLLADGITREMLDAQAKQAQFIQDLLDRLGDEERLRGLVEARRDEMTYEFFLMLTASIDATREEGDDAGAQRLTELRERLLVLTGGPPGTMPESLPEGITHPEIIEALLAVRGTEELRKVVAVNRPRLDYSFFQTLTGQIEAAQSAGDAEKARRLLDLRSAVLEIIDELDRLAQEAMQHAADLLRRILQSDDPRQTIADNIEQIDEPFLYVLSANIAYARREKQDEAVQALEATYTEVMAQLQERMPPEIRLINRLLAEEDRSRWTGILRGESAALSQQLVNLVEAMAEDARRQKDEKLAERLGEVSQKISQMLEGET